MIRVYVSELNAMETSYLLKTLCDEFIEPMGCKVLEFIVSEVKEAKYYSLITGSTPDITHVEQLSVIVRYSLHGARYERLVGFIPVKSHTAKSLFQPMESLLDTKNTATENCRGQSNDNASYRSEKYEGLQAQIKRLSPLVG